ncbi:uncharacterized protein LOC131634664 [Vicia villosa]|uniref:uncharacterized protein LOC131634664 n=1 Tax=Vicia villosa TaxID=3911 RepID=UPI00273B3644|nr:uncharacterized protein LOC131634664 [Vicia villosa]
MFRAKGKNIVGLAGMEKRKSRLDHFLVDGNIISSWGVVGQFIGKRDVSDHCPAIIVRGRGDVVLKEKFRIIKDMLRWWNNTVFGKYDLEVEEGVRELNEADDCDVLGEEIQAIKRKASSRFWLNLKIKENMLIQKSRLKWLNDGDSNSKYFHRLMKERRRMNHICYITTSSGIIDKVEEVKEEVRRHFNRKFKEDNYS